MNIDSVEDIKSISFAVHENSFDLLQADHTLSGIDIALWDILGKRLNEPVYKLLGYKKAYPKLPYASQLFGNTPGETFEKAKKTRVTGFKAVKFGWGPFGKTGLKSDIGHLVAAREGAGENTLLMIDAGTVWNDDVSMAKERLAILHEINAYWLEEPFRNMALGSYKRLSESTPAIALAGGEGCNNFVQSQAMIQYAGLGFIQIDAGRIGGITVAKRVADLAQRSNIKYVNHTFTSHLALSASLQPFAGIEKDIICEYPVESKSLAQDISPIKIIPDAEGFIHVPEEQGLGIGVDTGSLQKYLIDVEIRVGGKIIYYTPDL
jgi:L-alanine-DL-glutamate epimerase-like enolase superfamily enzyme